MSSHNEAAVTWQDFQPAYEKLLKTELTLQNVDAWLHDWSELSKDVREVRAQLNRAKDENTADKEAEAAFLRFVREINPEVQRADQRLKEKLLSLEGYRPPAEHEVFVRRFRADVELFREENVPLEAEHQALVNEYNKIAGAITVELDGQTMTIPQADRRLLETDRALRERAWRAIFKAKMDAAGPLDEVFLKLLALRRKIAANAGCRDYREYRWRQLYRFDYTPEDSLRLHDSIAAEVVPLIEKVREERRRDLGLEALRPWDMKVDPDSNAPLAPFTRVEELEEGLIRILRGLHPDLADQFATLRGGWMDLESRKGKVPGLGYQSFFPRSKRPYIYHSVNGTHQDVWVMLHEAGHAFHSLAASRQNELYWNVHPGSEFAEVASQSIELLTLPYLDREHGGFYAPAEAARARRENLERTLHQLPGQAQGDAFQHWLYADAGGEVTIEQMDAKWLELSRIYSPGIDFSGLEREQSKGWHYYHIFAIPFYMLEYSIAWLGAIQIWRSALKDQSQALSRYRAALALGGSRPLPELFESAGARWTFDRDHVGGLMRFVFEQRARTKA